MELNWMADGAVALSPPHSNSICPAIINYKVQIKHDSLHDAFIETRTNGMNWSKGEKKKNQDLILILCNKIINWIRFVLHKTAFSIDLW